MYYSSKQYVSFPKGGVSIFPYCLVHSLEYLLDDLLNRLFFLTIDNIITDHYQDHIFKLYTFLSLYKHIAWHCLSHEYM